MKKEKDLIIKVIFYPFACGNGLEIFKCRAVCLHERNDFMYPISYETK